MRLRKLEEKDAPLMLEWMHDDTVTRYLRQDFAGKTIEDCRRFIARAGDETENIHLAIVNEQDEYLGTVSLKHIRYSAGKFGTAARDSAMDGEHAAQVGAIAREHAARVGVMDGGHVSRAGVMDEEHVLRAGEMDEEHVSRHGLAEFGIALRSCAMGKGFAAFGMKEIFEYGYSTRGIDCVYWCVDPNNKRAVRFYEKYGFLRRGVPDEAVGYTDEEKREYMWYQIWYQEKTHG